MLGGLDRAAATLSAALLADARSEDVSFGVRSMRLRHGARGTRSRCVHVRMCGRTRAHACARRAHTTRARCPHACVHTRTRAHAHARMRARAHASTHARAHSHTHGVARRSRRPSRASRVVRRVQCASHDVRDACDACDACDARDARDARDVRAARNVHDARDVHDVRGWLRDLLGLAVSRALRLLSLRARVGGGAHGPGSFTLQLRCHHPCRRRAETNNACHTPVGRPPRAPAARAAAPTACMHTRTHTPERANPHANTRTHTCAHTHAHTCAHTCAHPHAHTHAHARRAGAGGRGRETCSRLMFFVGAEGQRLALRTSNDFYWFCHVVRLRPARPALHFCP